MHRFFKYQNLHFSLERIL